MGLLGTATLKDPLRSQRALPSVLGWQCCDDRCGGETCSRGAALNGGNSCTLVNQVGKVTSRFKAVIYSLQDRRGNV